MILAVELSNLCFCSMTSHRCHFSKISFTIDICDRTTI
jgi:hypothetical protein